MADPNIDTLAVPSLYRRTVTIHGREFQKYSVDNSIHLVPIDEDEMDRLEKQHEVLSIVFDDRLIFPPIANPKKVLDLGYGAASWAVNVAEAYPNCEVTGVDISPQMKPDDTPENFWPQLDDLNQSFSFSANSFDVVHSRLVAGGINRSRWQSYVRDIKKVLKPGGWAQAVECDFIAQSDNGSLTEAHALVQWSRKYVSALDAIKDPKAGQRLQALFSAAGFSDIGARMIPLPLCGWSNDPRQRRIGNANRDNVHHLLNNLAMLPCTRRSNMSIQDFRTLVARARADALNTNLRAYFRLYVCIGRKPPISA